MPPGLAILLVLAGLAIAFPGSRAFAQEPSDALRAMLKGGADPNGAKRTAMPSRPAPPPGADFEAVVAAEIDDVAFFDPPRFSLTMGNETGFAFYGDASNQFSEVRCERSANFGFIASANLAGGISVGVCTREAQRVRALAAAAQPALQARACPTKDRAAGRLSGQR